MDEVGPRGVGGEAEVDAAGVSGDAPGSGEQPQSQAFGFPPAGRVVGQGEQLHPRGELDGERDDRDPDLVLREAVQRQVGQAGVLADPNAVLGAGPTAMAQFQVGELAVGRPGVVLVAKAVSRCPSRSVRRTWAQGCVGVHCAR